MQPIEQLGRELTRIFDRSARAAQDRRWRASGLRYGSRDWCRASRRSSRRTGRPRRGPAARGRTAAPSSHRESGCGRRRSIRCARPAADRCGRVAAQVRRQKTGRCRCQARRRTTGQAHRGWFGIEPETLRTAASRAALQCPTMRSGCRRAAPIRPSIRFSTSINLMTVPGPAPSANRTPTSL